MHDVAVPGVVVTAESEALPGALRTVSDAAGRYRFLSVPLGTYTLTFSLTGFSSHRQTVEVKLGSQITANARMAVGRVTEIIEVTGAALSIDPTSSRSATNITLEQIAGLAKPARGFASLLALAPGVLLEPKNGAHGVGGVQVAGSSGAENGFYLDGTEVSDLRRGSLSEACNVPLELVQEVQVKTGGYEAEFGGAMGGVVNVATRSGTSRLHGSLGVQYTGSGLNGRDRGYYQASVADSDAAEFFRPREDRYHIFSPVLTLGGPIARDRLHFFAAYAPDLERTSRTVPYPDGARRFDQERRRDYSLARLDFNSGPRLLLNVTHVFAPSRRTGHLPSRDERVEAPANDTALQGGYVPSQQVSAGVAWSPAPKLMIGGRLGYRYQNDKDGNYGLSRSPFVRYRTPSSAAGIPVPTPGGTGFTNVSSTFGVVKDISTRYNAYFDLTYVATLAGQSHTLKAGYALNDVGNDVLNDHANGSFEVYWGQAFSRAAVTDERGRYGYYVWQDGLKNQGDVRGRNQGFYLQDTWRAGSRVTLNLGVRFESEYLPPYKSVVNGVRVGNPVSFGWGDKIAPRLGAAWDLRGDGRSKASATFGIFYDVLKYELARTAFGGDYWWSHVYRLDDPDVLKLSADDPGALGEEITAFDNRSLPIDAEGRLQGIDRDLEPAKGNELTLGLDHQFRPRLVGGVRYTRRRLLRAIEDIGVLDAAGSEVYLIGNPGRGRTRDPGSVYGGQAPNGTFLVPEAVRNYDALEVRGQGQFGGLQLLASYTWSRLHGNYSGGANSDESGRQDPGVSRAFDLPYYYFDASGDQAPKQGPLATDRPHAFKLFAHWSFRTRMGAAQLGLTQLLLSGAPDSTSVLYLSAPTFPFGRGDLGRTPAYSQTDLAVSHEFRLARGMRLRLEANVRNLFDQAAVISRVTQINQSGAIPQSRLSPAQFFAGYHLADFVNPANLDAAGNATSARYNPVYGLPGANYKGGGGAGAPGAVGGSSAYSARNANFGAYQDFRTIRLGVTLTF
jgi:hypothetical protein